MRKMIYVVFLGVLTYLFLNCQGTENFPTGPTYGWINNTDKTVSVIKFRSATINPFDTNNGFQNLIVINSQIFGDVKLEFRGIPARCLVFSGSVPIQPKIFAMGLPMIVLSRYIFLLFYMLLP